MTTAKQDLAKLKSHRDDLLEMLHERIENVTPEDVGRIVSAVCYLAYEYPQAVRNMEAA